MQTNNGIIPDIYPRIYYLHQIRTSNKWSVIWFKETAPWTNFWSDFEKLHKYTRSSGKNLWHLLLFKYLALHYEDIRSCMIHFCA